MFLDWEPTKKRKQVFKEKKNFEHFLSPEATTYASPIVSTWKGIIQN